MKPIPIGGSPGQKPSPDAQEKDGNTPEEVYELLLTADALKELEEAEAREVAQNRARLTGAGMVGSLLDIKV